MKLLVSVLIAYLVTSSGAMAQKLNWLSMKISSADTIVLVSHDCFGCLIDSHNQPLPVPPLVAKGHPNYKAFLKRRVLTSAQRTELSEILVRPFTDSVIVTMKCCEPHHTLFLIKGNHTSYLDICFACRCLDSSKDLTALYRLTSSQWPELNAFFTRLGLAYAE